MSDTKPGDGSGPRPFAAGESPVDLDLARAVAKDCGWSFSELAEFYCTGTERGLAELRRAIETENRAEACRLAHGSVGASQSTGVPGMARLFRVVERAAESGSLEGLVEHLVKLETGLDEIRRIFAREGGIAG